MTERDWRFLDLLNSLHYGGALASKELIEMRKHLLKDTEQEDEHPEWMESECYCYLCLSCA